MKNKAFVLLLAIFCFMLILNMMKPLSSDDYFIAFVWPEGTGINGPLSETAKRVSSLLDIYKSLKEYYFIWGGRIAGQSLITFFVWQGKEIFNVLNSFVFVILIAEIYWLSHEGKVSFDFDSAFILWIFFSLWSFNISFNDTFLWLSGSCEYMWMLVILLAFLLPYVRNYYDREFLKKDNWITSIGMFFLGVIAGDSRETIICWIILVLFLLLYRDFRKNNIQCWKLLGVFGLCIGYAVLVFAPGNVSRLAIQQHSASFLIPKEILVPKLIESVEIISFHLFLWYFILKFLYSYEKCRGKEGAALSIDTEKKDLYLYYIKAFTAIPLGSGLLMFLIQSEAFRPSFINLVFLIIAAASIFRFGSLKGISVIHENSKKFLKTIGLLYLLFTIACSVWGNYVNWQQWNSILALVKTARQNGSVDVLEIEPYPIRDKHRLMLLSGFHIMVMPFNGEDEEDSINRSFARYYNIKGIKILNNNLNN